MTSSVDNFVKVIISLAIVAFFVGAFYLIRYLFRKFKTMNIRSKTIEAIIKKADAKIKKRELLSLKAELAREHKSIDDYSSEEINLILLDKREKIVSKIKDKSLLGLLIRLLLVYEHNKSFHLTAKASGDFKHYGYPALLAVFSP